MGGYIKETKMKDEKDSYLESKEFRRIETWIIVLLFFVVVGVLAHLYFDTTGTVDNNTKVYKAKNPIDLPKPKESQYALEWTLDELKVPYYSVVMFDHENISKRDLRTIGNRYGIDGSILYAMMLKESGGDCSKVSSRGAKGCFQFLDDTAREFGILNDTDVFRQADAAARYMAWLHLVIFDSHIANANLESLKITLAAYNAGLASVLYEDGPKIPLYKETIKYVDDIIGYYLGNKHYVRRGERLNTIATNYGITVTSLRFINDGVCNVKLKHSVFINVNPQDYSYMVRKGDTLYRLAKRYNTTIEDLRIKNGINGDLLKVGMSLKVI